MIYRQNNKQQYEKDITLHAYAADDGSDDTQYTERPRRAV